MMIDLPIQLMPAHQRRILLDRFGDVGRAAPSMVARVVEATPMDPSAKLPFVLRRLLDLEAEVERLRAARDDTAPDEGPADIPSERVEFVEHDYGVDRVFDVCVAVTFPGPQPRELGTLDLSRDDWAVLRRVLGNAGPSVTFVRYSRQAGARDVA